MSTAVLPKDITLDTNYDEEPSTPSQDRAEEHLRLLAYWQRQRAERQSHANQQQDRITNWLAREQDRIDRKIGWHQRALQGFFWQTGKKSVRLIHGIIRRIKGRERIDVTDEQAFLRHTSMDLIREQTHVQPNKKAILAQVRETGDLPAGIDLVRGDDTIQIKAEE